MPQRGKGSVRAVRIEPKVSGLKDRAALGFLMKETNSPVRATDRVLKYLEISFHIR